MLQKFGAQLFRIVKYVFERDRKVICHHSKMSEMSRRGIRPLLLFLTAQHQGQAGASIQNEWEWHDIDLYIERYTWSQTSDVADGTVRHDRRSWVQSATSAKVSSRARCAGRHSSDYFYLMIELRSGCLVQLNIRRRDAREGYTWEEGTS